MSEPLFIFMAQGTATPASTYRAGARHAMIIFATGKTITDARSDAVAKAHDNFWTHVELKREKEIDRDTRAMSDEILKAAAESALAEGASIVVYSDELPLDS